MGEEGYVHLQTRSQSSIKEDKLNKLMVISLVERFKFLCDETHKFV